MRRIEPNHPSLFDVLETDRHATLEPARQAGPPRPVPRRPPMLRRPRARRGAAWGTAAALTLAGVSGLSLLWWTQGADAPAAPAPFVLRVAPTARWTPAAVASRFLPTTPPPVPVDAHPVPPPAVAEVPAAPADGGAPAVAELVWKPAVKTEAAPPAYPEAAREAGLTGTVVAEATIDAAGAVTATRIVRGVAPELDQAARDALAGWHFEPATRGGEPVPSTYRVAFDFQLEPPPLLAASG